MQDVAGHNDAVTTDSIADLFRESSIDHGEIFDDGRRWCDVCQHTKPICEQQEDKSWAGKMCQDCSTLWPEYAFAIAHGLITEDDFDDVEENITVH